MRPRRVLARAAARVLSNSTTRAPQVDRGSVVPAGPATAADTSSLAAALGDLVPGDHARQVSSRYFVDVVMRADPRPRRVLDLGCGSGDSVDLFRRYDPDVEWIGVDIADSQEALARLRHDATFVTYDGLVIPFPDASFDLVYSHQVLEHVRDPLGHLREIRRVLRPTGRFVGSTSQLEPYHSRSFWNFTPAGLVQLAAEAGLAMSEIRPGIDGVTLTLRTWLGRSPMFGPWWDSDSPLNAAIDDWARETGASPRAVNLRKLQVAGQFAFVAQPAGEPGGSAGS